MSTVSELSIISGLAWRNVWKNKRRTILTLLTILVGSGMIIFLNALATGGHEQMIEDAVASNTGHIQIHSRGFWENKSIDYAFNNHEKIIEKIKLDKGIAAFSKRIHAGGLLSYRDSTSAALIQGVDPDNEKNISSIHRFIIKGGRYLESNDEDSIVIGKTLAKNLGVENGDSISIISQGFDGSIAAENLNIVGIFNTGNPEYDAFLVIMNINRAAETFSMMDFINSIVIRLNESSQTVEVKNRLISSINNKEIEILGWDELMPELVQFIVMDDFSAYIFDFILLMVVAFGILNTIQMSVFERIREIGVMLAIGTRPGQVSGMIILESVYISVIGISLGLIVGSSLSYYFALNPMDYSSYADEITVWGITTVIFPAKLTGLNLIVTSSLTFMLSIIFTIFPAKRASKLKPVEAIRHL